MLLVTGGAGFIGSNVVAALNEAGRTDIELNALVSTVIEIGSWRPNRSGSPPPVLFTIQELMKLKLLVMQEEQEKAEAERAKKRSNLAEGGRPNAKL